jgi:trans-aconitate methyltransferase
MWSEWMERLVGKRRVSLGANEFARIPGAYAEVLLDIGTGDGRFVDAMARQHPTMLAIGLDACREPLAQRSRRAPANALYLIANALTLPEELEGLVTCVTLNFPWGSLLEALLAKSPRLLERLAAIARPGARVDVRLNAAAVAACGATLEETAAVTRGALAEAGFRVLRARTLGPADLRAFPSTWAHRLAFGTDPRAISLSGRRQAPVSASAPGDCARVG